MAKLKDTPITNADLIEFVDNKSDFAFELKCLERLSDFGFTCQHGGSYTDPVTKKARQFDIRAFSGEMGWNRLLCAVECKNLTPNFPLLVLTVPRTREESYHDVLLSFPAKWARHDAGMPGFERECRTLRLRDYSPDYAQRKPVGKSLTQVGREANNNELTGSNRETFEKWSQALASAHDLFYSASESGAKEHNVITSFVLPIVVVPDDMLWCVDYDNKGHRQSDPQRVEWCSLWLGHEYEVGDHLSGTKATVSHLDVVTFSGLEYLENITKNNGNCWFPYEDKIQEQLAITDTREPFELNYL